MKTKTQFHALTQSNGSVIWRGVYKGCVVCIGAPTYLQARQASAYYLWRSR